MPNMDVVTALLQFGLVGAFIVTAMEKFVPIFPSYVILLTLGMGAQDPSRLLLLLGVTVAGSLCGSAGWYGCGRWLGEQRVRRLVSRFGRYVFLSPAAYEKMARSYRRNRIFVTSLGQVIPVARVYLGLPAGIMKLPLGSFVASAAAGICVWNAPFLLLGFCLKGDADSLATVHLWASIALVAGEAAILGLIALCRAPRQRGR